MKTRFYLCGLIAVAVAGSAGAANFCGDLKASFGPFDYRHRSENAENFNLVESAHFTSDVENGVKGNTGLIGGDLSYTLVVIPNHLRALTTLSRLAMRSKQVQIDGMRYPVECYFDRAVRFAPDDGSARAQYASYLYMMGKLDKSFAMYKEAARLEPENAVINYNLGLAYARQNDYANAKIHAKKAYAAGFPLPGLKNKLVEAHQWDDKPAE